MEYYYDERADILTLNFGAAKVAVLDDSPEHAGVVMEYSGTGKLVHMRLLNASQCVEDPSFVSYGEGVKEGCSGCLIALWDSRTSKKESLAKLKHVHVSLSHEEPNIIMIRFRKAKFMQCNTEDFEERNIVWDIGTDGKPYDIEIIDADSLFADPEAYKSMHRK